MTREDRWQGRPWVAFVIRALVFLIPIGLSVLSALALQRVIPKPASLMGAIVWWLGIAAVSTLVLWVADKGARRALPLAALFKLSLVFPDQAPSRYKIARKAGNLRDLESELDLAREQGLAGDRTAAAETILKLVAHLSEHDRATRGHSERVRVFTDMLADELDLDEEQRDRLRWAALLHDVGKLTVHTDVLNKPGKPTEEEWVQLKHHPVAGAEITQPLHGWLGEWALAVEQHHEKYDGSGYPGGLSGTGISWGARIVAVADAYDTMTAARAYKKPMSAVDARRELATCAGSHFDPVVVRAFLSISLGRLRLAMGPLSWLAQGGPLANVSGRVIEFGTTAAAAAGVASVAVVPQMIDRAPSVPRETVIAAPSEDLAPSLPPLPAPSPTPAPPAGPDATASSPPPPGPAEPEAAPTSVVVPVQRPQTQPQSDPTAPVAPSSPAPSPAAPDAPTRPQPQPTAAPSPTPSPKPAPVVVPIATIAAAPGAGAQVAPGDTIAVTVRVTMPSDATAATSSSLTLPLPAGSRLVPGSLTVDGARVSGPDPTAGSITLPELAPGETVVVSYTLEIVPDAREGTVVVPTAQVRTSATTVSAGLGSGLTVRLPLPRPCPRPRRPPRWRPAARWT